MKTPRLFNLMVVSMVMLLGLAACAAPDTAPGASAASPGMTTSAPAARDIAGAITGSAPLPSASVKTGLVDLSCKTDSDCAIKDVGSCCGARPQCVNTGSATFPDQVKAACVASDSASICGFPSIVGCQCVAGQCAASEGHTTPARMD